MEIYRIMNPDAKFPFYLDAILARNKLSGSSRFDILKFVHNKLRDKQKPVHSEKYAKPRETEELKFLSQIYEECTSFDPRQRMTVKQLATLLSHKNDHLLVVPLKVSQNSAIERYDMQVAAGQDDRKDNLPLNDGVSACSFISVVHNCNAQDYLIKSIIQDTERSITDLPLYFNAHRNTERLYDAQEAFKILRQADVIGNDSQLTEVLTSHCLYTESGRKTFMDAMEKLQNEMLSSQRKASVAIYMFGQYRGFAYINYLQN